MNIAFVKKVIQDAEKFIDDFSNKIYDNSISDSAKQVLILDNQTNIKTTMEELNQVKKDS